MPDSGGVTTIGGRIAQARRLLGVRERTDITPTELARRLKVQPSTVLRWEADKRPPDADNLFRLADVLRVDVRWLKTGEGSPEVQRANGLPPAELRGATQEEIAKAMADAERAAARERGGPVRRRRKSS